MQVQIPRRAVDTAAAAVACDFDYGNIRFGEV